MRHMKTFLVVGLALALAGCESSPEKASLTGAQAITIAREKLPPLQTNSAYASTFNDGYWQIYVIPATEKAGIIDFSLATNVWHSIATVRDADGKFEVRQ